MLRAWPETNRPGAVHDAHDDLLAVGPGTAADLSRAGGTQARSLDRLLRALASVGVFSEGEGGRVKPWPWRSTAALGRWAFAALFVAAGVAHFARPDVYLRIMPPYLPYGRALVLLSGGFEVVLGLLLLVPATSRLAAWGLIALLVAVFPANVHMYLHADRFPLSPTLLLLRLPLQAVLIFWAYAYTRRRPP